jgi:hypothetical protein
MDTPFIQHSELAGYKEKVTMSECLDRYSDDLEEKDIKRLSQYNTSVYGTDQSFSSPDGNSVGS